MKIFKKLLPVVIGLSLIIVIAITIVIVNPTNSKTPKLSNGEESYLQFGNLQLLNLIFGAKVILFLITCTIELIYRK